MPAYDDRRQLRPGPRGHTSHRTFEQLSQHRVALGLLEDNRHHCGRVDDHLGRPSWSYMPSIHSFDVLPRISAGIDATNSRLISLTRAIVSSISASRR